jgi:acyl-coenzyme A thioesterase PaaI-like protein
VTHLGRRTALAEAKLTSSTGKLLATATSNCLILNA